MRKLYVNFPFIFFEDLQLIWSKKIVWEHVVDINAAWVKNGEIKISILG